MANTNTDPSRRVSFHVSTKERPPFNQPLVAYVFDERGALAERVEVKGDKAELSLPKGGPGRTRVFLAPRDEKLDAMTLTPAAMQRIGAYEPVLIGEGGKLIDRIDVPGVIIDHWPLCFCWVRGRVVRNSDNRAVCDARVHICEVDRIIWWILKLPDLDVLRLRDDLLKVIQHPMPRPRPIPDPDPGPLRRFFGPGPDPAPLSRPALRFAPQVERVALNPQPLPPRDRMSRNPQPEPPGGRTFASASIQLAPEVHAALQSASTIVVRKALVENWKLIVPWFCIWPRWWWRFRCDEVAVVTTDSQGRFERTIFYPCGDQPDLYFWVEYDFGSGFETVYHPPIACHTYWDYACGTEVTIRVTDPRVPGCEGEPDLPGRQVVVLSIGPGIAVRQAQTSGAAEGLTVWGAPFGDTLEPRVDFSRTALLGMGIKYYRWSYTRLSAPDGGGGPVDAASVPLGAPAVMTREVYRHYKDGATYPSLYIGPLPTVGPDPAPLPNLFQIHPADSPSGEEWYTVNEHIDLATAYFDTASLAGAPSGVDPTPADLAAGRYEMKLELFDTAGALVNWTAAGIDLRITDQDAPFGPGTITTSPAPNYNRILVGANTMGFRMVVRVDNNRCFAEIQPVGGTVTPDPDCGFHYYSSPSDAAGLSFIARHPNHFATYGFTTERGTGPAITDASTSGVAGEPGTNGFVEVSDFTYSKNVTVSTLLGTDCTNAAFSERLDVYAMATNGYTTLIGYNRADNAAFALAVPCPPCECNEKDKNKNT